MTRYTPTAKNYIEYRGNGTYSFVLRYYAAADDCTGPVPSSAIGSRSTPAPSVAAPPGRALTRAPNGFITNTYRLGIGLNPGASTYEVRYALGGVQGPDGAISGPSSRRSWTARPGSPTSASTSPGRWLIVARAK